MNYKQIELGEDNREAVQNWFMNHLCGTQRECAKDLNISTMAVNRHVKTIRAQWRKLPK